MKLGCISWSYRNEFADGKYDISTWILHCARDVKLDGVELWNNYLRSLEEEYLDSISTLCSEERVDIYSVATKCLFGKFSKDEIEGEKTTLRNWFFLATNRLGVSIMRVSIGGEQLRSPAHQQIVFESLSDVINEGAHPNITVGIENQEPGMVQDLEDVIAMDHLSEGKLKLILDNGSIIDKSTVYQFMEDTLPYAALTHAKFFEIDDRGADIVLDYDKILPILTKFDYDGHLSIEYDSDGLASEDVPRIARYLRERI